MDIQRLTVSATYRPHPHLVDKRGLQEMGIRCVVVESKSDRKDASVAAPSKFNARSVREAILSILSQGGGEGLERDL